MGRTSVVVVVSGVGAPGATPDVVVGGLTAPTPVANTGSGGVFHCPCCANRLEASRFCSS